jgi:hypothetical protein
MSNFKIGKLKFKEGSGKPAYIPKKARKAEEKEEEEQDIVTEDKIISYEPKEGTGAITSSGRTVHGQDTQFYAEIEKGDSILITHPVFKTVEERTVTLVLSSKSILLEEPFLEEYSTFVPFQIRKKSTIIPGANLTQEYKEKL